MPLKGLTPGSFSSFPVPRTAASGGSNIKSIQRGVANTFTSATLDVTLPTAIDVTKAIVLVSYSMDLGGQPQYSCANASILNATTIRITKAAFSSTLPVSWQVIEYYNVKSNQKGSVSLVASGTVTIASVDLSKSVLYISYTSDFTSSSNSLLNANMRYDLTNATTINIFIDSAPATYTIRWQVVEFY